MLTELFLALFILFIVLALMFAPSGLTSTETLATKSTTKSPPDVPGILVPANHPKKNLTVGFAEMREERVFSKKTGKVKYDKVTFT